MEGSSGRAQRNIRERSRRMQMKNLTSSLASLIHPSSPSRLSVPEVVEQATTYIKQLQERMETLKRRRTELGGSSSDGGDCNESSASSSSRLPVLDIRASESTLEINLISGSKNKKIMLWQIISILEEEGAEVVSASNHTTGDSTIYIIKAQALCPRIGIETSRVQIRLMDLV